MDVVVIKKIMDLLEKQFGRNCEVVLHDLTKDYNHTIIDIRNGHVTGRKIGDCGSNLGLEVLRGSVVNGDRYNYITHTKDGKVLRSSSVYFYNDNNKVIGSLCINLDITEELRFENYLKARNNYSLDVNEDKEVFATDVKQLLEHFISEGQRLVGKPIVLMDRGERLQFLKYLDDAGAFLITKSSERIIQLMGISKGTLYSYLEILRNGNDISGNEVDDIEDKIEDDNK
jgi:predicted transcriptional regulator YheO